MVAGSSFLEDLNSDDPTPGQVRYVTVATLDDGVVQPVTRAAIPGAENVIMQTYCPDRDVGHFGLLSDAWTQQVVVAVLSGGAPEGDCGASPVGGAL
jgi:triacylglycerol lipase